LPFASFGGIIGIWTIVIDDDVVDFTIPIVPIGPPCGGGFEASRNVASCASVYAAEEDGDGIGSGLDAVPTATGDAFANNPA
jgi:hypothetical protein